MPPKVRFSITIPGADRIYYVGEQDVRTVLSRIPVELWGKLRAVHFNDRSRGARCLGYVNTGRHDISICALPPRVSLMQALVKGQTAEQFGAISGCKWPVLAVRRFILYDVFLHELGHLQLIDKNARSPRLKFAREKLAQAFAMDWCSRLWSKPFDHPDPVHNPPTTEEISALSIA